MIKENVICSSSCQALLLIFLLLTERCVCRAVIEGKRECNDTKIQIEEQTTTDTRRKVDERKKKEGRVDETDVKAKNTDHKKRHEE